MEWLLLWRQPQEWLYPLVFFIMATSLFPLAITLEGQVLTQVMVGYLWFMLLFCSLLSGQTIFLSDLEEGYLEQMALDDLPMACHVMVKILARGGMMVPWMLFVILFSAVMQLPVITLMVLCAGLLCSMPILWLLSCLSVALTIGLRQQGMLLGILMIPLGVPILIFGASSTEQTLVEGASYWGPLLMLAGLCILAVTCLPSVIAAAIRMRLDE